MARTKLRLQDAARAGVEGTHVQGIRRGGRLRSWYFGLAKTHLQHLITAVALNVVRLGTWWLGTPQANTRRAPVAALRVAVASASLSHEFTTSIDVGEVCTAALPFGLAVAPSYRMAEAPRQTLFQNLSSRRTIALKIS